MTNIALHLREFFVLISALEIWQFIFLQTKCVHLKIPQYFLSKNILVDLAKIYLCFNVHFFVSDSPCSINWEHNFFPFPSFDWPMHYYVFFPFHCQKLNCASRVKSVDLVWPFKKMKGSFFDKLSLCQEQLSKGSSF